MYISFRFATTDDPIKEGDYVFIQFTEGLSNQVIIGKLTWLDPEYPDCCIDDIPVSLASEGHSSKMYKIYLANPK